MGKERRIKSAGPAIVAAVSFVIGMLISPEAHAGVEMITGEGGLLSTLLTHVLGFDGPGAEGPRCAGFRACDLLFVALIGLVVVAFLRFRHATQRKRLDLARRMVEQGMEPPAELLGRAGNDLRRGLVLAFTGVGLLAASFLGGNGDLSPAGLIPGFIGLGYLASHRFAGRKRGPQP
jgi:hypothetical protein